VSRLQLIIRRLIEKGAACCAHYSLPVSLPSYYPILLSYSCFAHLSYFVSLSLCLVLNSLCLSLSPFLSVGCIDRRMIIKVWWRWPDSDSVFCWISSWISHRHISACLALYLTFFYLELLTSNIRIDGCWELTWQNALFKCSFFF